MGLKTLQWLARILAIATIFFMMLFSFDSMIGDGPIGRKLLGLFIENIPSLVIIVLLVIAWNREITGGVLFILAFIGLAISFRSFTENHESLIVISPLLITGASFIIHQLLETKRKS